MKKVILSLSVFGMLIFMASCGGPSEKTITVSDVAINGNSKSNIEVVPGDYTVKSINDIVVIAIKLRLTQPFVEYREDRVDGGYWHTLPKIGNLNLAPLDASGIPIADIGLDFSPTNMSDWEKIKDLLHSEVGSEKIIVFEWDYWSDSDKQDRIMEEMAGFELVRADFSKAAVTGDMLKKKAEIIKEADDAISSIYKKKGSKEWDEVLDEYEEFIDNYINDYANSISNDSDDDISSIYKKKGSKEWDEALDEYEEFIDNYIKFMKKAKDGDLSAITEYGKLLISINELGEKFNNANDDLSASQMSRYVSLQAKFLDGALSIYK